jgi:class 3 adenylate cyclase/pimeloyl-ACP methyl ester carboxylesterase
VGIRDWLRSIELDQYAETFEREQIDRDSVRHLSDADIKDLGLPIGHRSRLRAAIQMLGGSAAPASASEDVAEHPSPQFSGAERRQLTVMFCDLVGSTALSERLDPEELRAVLHAYRMECGQVIARYEGQVARYVGDGILTYFGWPKAHEEDAERSIRAALEIIGAVKNVPAPETLSVRIGIATGPVVVGEQAGEGTEAKLAIGSTPNLAARLQALAGADQIVIAASTRKLVGNAFELGDLGTHTLKGISDPVHPWLVKAIAETRGRFQAGRAVDHLTPLVGRKEEIALLLRRWEQVKDVEGQVVLISGEAGIGKSRIVHALIERLKDEEASPAQVQLQCSSFHANSSYHPLIAHLGRCARLAPEDTPSQKLDKLSAVLEQGDVASGTSGTEAVAFVAEILGVPPGDRYPAPRLSAAEQKEKTLQVLASQIVGTGQGRATLLVIEDAQWADPSTLDAVNAIIDRGHTERLLVVITYRPEFTHTWFNHPNVTHLPLGRLTRREAVLMVERLAEIGPMPSELLDEVVARTDGIPLFIEEVSRGLIESALPTDQSQASGFASHAATPSIPATVQDALTARLDRLSAAKEIAQIGAAIGREFAHELVAAVSPLSAVELERALTQLIESGLVFRSGSGPQASYTFRHGLVQEVAYQSLLKARRQELHRSIASEIGQRFPHVATTQPEQLAHHCFRAGLTEQAARLWLRAGTQAKTRLALSEAIHHARRGLEAIGESGIAGFADIRVDLLTLLGDLESLMSLPDDANRHYREAAGLAVEPQRRRRVEDKLHHSKAVVRDGARIVYHEHGVGDDTLLFINPIAYALGTFQPLVERLCHEFRLVTVQCRGAGASDPLVRPYRTSDHVEDVRAIIQAIGKPVIGVGISRGSNLLARLAAQDPALIEKLILVGCPFCDLMAEDNPFPPSEIYRAQRTALYQLQDTKALVELHMAYVYPEPVMRYVREQSIRTLLGLPRETIMSFFDLDPELDIRGVLSQIAVPTLVAHGTEDQVALLASGRYVSEHIPGARFYAFEGKGHLPMFTAIDEFCDVLRRFVGVRGGANMYESGRFQNAEDDGLG